MLKNIAKYSPGVCPIISAIANGGLLSTISFQSGSQCEARHMIRQNLFQTSDIMKENIFSMNTH